MHQVCLEQLWLLPNLLASWPSSVILPLNAWSIRKVKKALNAAIFLYRLQSQVAELNAKIETVNRERKYHQVKQNYHASIFFFRHWTPHFWEYIFIFIIIVQQNTAYELNALSTQWRELCLKNIEIQSACAEIENQIEEMKREATER